MGSEDGGVGESFGQRGRFLQAKRERMLRKALRRARGFPESRVPPADTGEGLGGRGAAGRGGGLEDLMWDRGLGSHPASALRGALSLISL